MASGTPIKSARNSDQAGTIGSTTDSTIRSDELDRQIVDRDLSSGIDDNTGGDEENSSNAKKFIIDEPPIKRKRGRPPNSTKTAGNTSSNTTNKRTDKTTDKLDKVVLTPDTVQKFSAFYLFLNNTIATSQKSPDFIISIDEAQAVGEPLAEILNDMGLLGLGLDTPYMRLAMAVAGVYGGRVMFAIQMNKEKQKQKQKSESVQPANIEDIVSMNAPTMKFE